MATSKRQQIVLSEAAPIFLRFIETHRSPNTRDSYAYILKAFIAHVNDLPINSVRAEDVEDFLYTMRHTPFNANRGAATGETLKYRKPKTIANMHIALSSFWSWATQRGYAKKDIMNAIPITKVYPEPVDPLTDVELSNLLRACVRSREYRSKADVTNLRVTSERDRAIIALLAETAIRVTEAANLRIGDVTFEPGQAGGSIRVILGKGGKSRIVPFSRRCGGWLKEYMALRHASGEDEWLFVVTKGRSSGRQMDRKSIRRIIVGLGQRIGIHANPHRLRTTAACMMLQNGMGIYDLQRIMGHNDLKTTRRYIAAARVDLALAMKKHSPLDNIRL
ncbi:MAG: tyrosine-type recombinase/integrase [Anaerolineae bacterium]|nr:tyrosine-type recombinase/integrase [Anaerolineae bacterium]